jgi:hypothetical protein
MSNMMLITSTWKSGKTFKMIPTDAECPYVECIFDADMKVLAVIGAIQKDIFHMMPKIDPNGDIEMRKTPSREGKPYKEERRTIETFQEYYVEQLDEIRAFVKRFAFNADTFDFEQYLLATPTTESAE